MSLNNKISAEITAEQMAKVMAQLQEAKTTLKDVLIFNLTADERQTMLKMGDRTLAFVGRAISHAKQSPDLVPSFLDVAKHKKITSLQPICMKFISKRVSFCGQ